MHTRGVICVRALGWGCTPLERNALYADGTSASAPSIRLAPQHMVQWKSPSPVTKVSTDECDHSCAKRNQRNLCDLLHIHLLASSSLCATFIESCLLTRESALRRFALCVFTGRACSTAIRVLAYARHRKRDHMERAAFGSGSSNHRRL
jgi:hypothetical protein